MYKQAPFDLMHGFRGSNQAVDVITPYEMLMHYTMERILPPTFVRAAARATWTEEGIAYRQMCAATNTEANYEAGIHYEAAPSEDRILLPDTAALRGLRHRWCWEPRPRLDLPTWSFAKVPRPQLSPEENARLLCVYLRPWTLSPTDCARNNPLLSMLGKCYCSEGGLTPAWTQLPSQAAHDPQGSQAATETAAATHGAVSEVAPSPKRRRLSRKTSQSDAPQKHRLSYASSWEAYMDGNVVSESSRRYIVNMLAATAATKTEDSGDSSEDSDAEAWATMNKRAGSMQLVQQTLQGMAARNSEEGVKAMGPHARTIRLGRALWESPPLVEEVANTIEETLFDGDFPPLAEMRKAVANVKQPDEQRPTPFAGKTQPFVNLSVINYGRRLDDWMAALLHEAEAPTTEQYSLLTNVKDRVLLEFQLEKEGLLLPKGHPERQAKEEPLLGFCHGSPGTGKSRAIAWIRRMFIEALGWEHEQDFVFDAFPHRVAHAMGGNTMHAGGGIAIGGQRALDHTDIDILFTRNQYLRWVIIDELPMVPDDLLGAFEHHLADASVESRYKHRADMSVRLFGGYNMLGVGDFYQIPPNLAYASLAIPPIEKKTETALRALNLLWKDRHDSLNLFVELTIQKRIDDPWYASVMEECRRGALSHEAYNFLVGLPTEHAGSWCADGTLQCKSQSCATLPETWRPMSAAGGELGRHAVHGVRHL